MVLIEFGWGRELVVSLRRCLFRFGGGTAQVVMLDVAQKSNADKIKGYKKHLDHQGSNFGLLIFGDS